VEEQLKKFPITRTNYILFNKGFKKCKKNIHMQIPPIDLVDAFLHVFADANEKGYQNILVLEDDFIFNELIHQENIQEEINRFLKDNQENEFAYYFGCIPFLQIPSFSPHRRLIIQASAHSVVYSRSLRTKILEKKQETIRDWDYLLSLLFVSNLFMYYRPLTYQLYPVTENSKYWGYYHNYTFPIILKYITPLLELDKKVEPGTTYLYWFSIWFFWFLLFFAILIVYFLFTLVFSTEYGAKRSRVVRFLRRSLESKT
jgi:hypothetical protein